MQLAYSRASKLEGSDCFQLRISLPEVTGHSTTTSKTKVDMSTIPEDYTNFTDIFSESKAGKLADHRPYDLQNHTGRRHFPPFGPIYSLSQEELALCVSSLMRTLLQGSSILLLLPWARFFSSEKRWLTSTLCLTSEPHLNLLERPVPTSAHFDSRRTKKSTNLHQNRPSACLPSSSGCIRRWMKTAFWTRYVPSNGLVMPEGLLMLQQLFTINEQHLCGYNWHHCHRIFGRHPHLFWQHFRTQSSR